MKRLQIPTQMGVYTVVVVWGFLAIGALGWALFVVLDAFGATQTASAWVQAVGSLSAVFTAVYVANKQARDTAQARRRRDEVAMKLVCGVAARAAAVSSLLFTNFQQMQDADEALKTEILTTVEEQLLALRGINPIELPLPEMVEPFLKIRGALEQSIIFAQLLSRKEVIDRMRCATVLAINSQATRIAASQLSDMKLD